MKHEGHLFLDQNIRYEVKERLQAEGVDVVHASDVGMERALDPDILHYATKQERALVTLDADFGDLNLFPLPSSHHGVVRLKITPSTPGVVLEKLLLFLDKHEPEDVRDALVVITRNRVRIRRQVR